MEMVKVDVQKLQLLNDRIAQTIEALNQVRLSVHGIQHTSPWPTQGFANPAYASPYGLYGYPTFPSSFAPPPPGYPVQLSPFGAGIQHSSFAPISPYLPYSFATSPWTISNGHVMAFDPTWTSRVTDPSSRTTT